MQRITNTLQCSSNSTDALRQNISLPAYTEQPGLTPVQGVFSTDKIPQTPDIQPELLQAGAPENLASSLYKHYCAKAEVLRQCFLVRMSASYQRSTIIPGGPNDKLTQTFLHILRRQLVVWKEELVHSVQSKCNDSSEKICRRSFKAECVPLLESYFERNAYPSISDRATLARRTKLTSRQVEVWFQNHRNRRRATHRLKKSPNPVILTGFLGDHAEYFPDKCTTPTSERTEYSGSLSVILPPSQTALLPSQVPFQPNLLNPPTPRHAYPTVYPPTCDYDPFPVKKGPGHFQLPPLEWIRKPCCLKPKRLPKAEGLMDDSLCQDFASRLSTYRGNRRKRSRDQLELDHEQPWRPPTYVYLNQGRHPSFVRTAAPKRIVSYAHEANTRGTSPRPTKRSRTSQRTSISPTCSPYSPASLSSRSSSGTLDTPADSLRLNHKEMDISSHSLQPEANLYSKLLFKPGHTLVFEAYAGPSIPFWPLNHGTR